ncbi:MAG: DUF1640 domain-containing protein [Gemmatimonadaceae bacterium]|nr:DUF1640 domain-containing protein [Acetobacteraceae bacterium]
MVHTMTMVFDTLAFVRTLEAAEISRRHADAMSDALHTAVGQAVASKVDVTDPKAEVAALRAEIAELRAEMRAEFAAVRAEMHAEIAAVRAEMHAEFAAVRAEMRSEFAAVRAEMHQGRAEMKLWVISFGTGALVTFIGAVAALLRLMLPVAP